MRPEIEEVKELVIKGSAKKVAKASHDGTTVTGINLNSEKHRRRYHSRHCRLEL